MARRRFSWEHIVLAALLLGLFWLRLELATSVDTFEYGAYHTLREVEYVQQTGHPLRVDSLSITGHERIGSPVYAYLLAVLASISPAFLKIFPNLCMTLLLVPVFFLARTLSGSNRTGLVAATLAAAGPVVFSAYLADPSPVPFATLLFLTILALLHDTDGNLHYIVGFTLLLTFIHPIVFLLVLAFLAIILLLRLEGFSVDSRFGELFLFTLFLATWFHVIVYKRALVADGLRIVWKNLPAQYASAAFGNPTFLAVIYGLGVIAFLFGVLGSYHAIFEKRERVALAVLGAIIATAASLLLRIVELRWGMMLLTLLLAVMAAYGLRISGAYIGRTKMPRSRYLLGALLVALFLLSAVLPSLSNAKLALENTPGADDLVAYAAASRVLPTNAVVLTTLREADAFQYYANRTTVTDDDFALVRNGDELVADIEGVYTARFVSGAIGKADKLAATHILFSSDAAKTYGRDAIAIETSSCIGVTPISQRALLYDLRCKGETP